MSGVHSRPYYSLAQTVSAVEDGKTFGGQGYEGLTLHVEGIVATDVIQVEAANDDDLAYVQIGTDITVDGVYAIELGARYYRATVSDNSGGGLILAVFLGA